MFDSFTLNGVSYYKKSGIFYADNMTVRSKLTLKEYTNAMTEHIIRSKSN